MGCAGCAVTHNLKLFLQSISSLAILKSNRPYSDLVKRNTFSIIYKERTKIMVIMKLCAYDVAVTLPVSHEVTNILRLEYLSGTFLVTLLR